LKIILQTLALLLFLVVLPFGSWYYLKNGMDYRVATMGELKHYGKIPTLSYTTYTNQTLTDSFFINKILIASVLDLKNPEMSETFGEVLEKLHEQFNERKDVLFLLHLADTSATQAAVDDFMGKYKLKDTEQCLFLKTPANTTIAAIGQTFHLPPDNVFPYFSLTDTKGEIRHYYDVRKIEEVRKLVEHTALLVPLEKTQEITLKREQEK
jgi:hypothetical protein